MATDLNRCDFIGRLGKDVELKKTKTGDSIANFSVAVNETYTSKQGEKVKKTEWINVVAFRKLADICFQYLSKGSHVYVSGKLNTNKYTSNDGIERYSTRILLEQLQMLGKNYHQDDSSAPKEEASGKAEVSDFDTQDIPF